MVASGSSMAAGRLGEWTGLLVAAGSASSGGGVGFAAACRSLSWPPRVGVRACAGGASAMGDGARPPERRGRGPPPRALRPREALGPRPERARRGGAGAAAGGGAASPRPRARAAPSRPTAASAVDGGAQRVAPRGAATAGRLRLAAWPPPYCRPGPDTRAGDRQAADECEQALERLRARRIDHLRVPVDVERRVEPRRGRRGRRRDDDRAAIGERERLRRAPAPRRGTERRPTTARRPPRPGR